MGDGDGQGEERFRAATDVEHGLGWDDARGGIREERVGSEGVFGEGGEAIAVGIVGGIGEGEAEEIGGEVSGVGRAWGAIGGRAAAPVGGEGVVREGGWGDEDEREAVAVGFGGPWGSVVVGELADGSAGAEAEADGFAGIGEIVARLP